MNNWLTADIDWLKAAIIKKEREHQEDTPEVSEKLYWVVTILVLTLIGAALAAMHYYVPAEQRVFKYAFNPHWFGYVLTAIYLLAGLHAVDTDKLAGLDFAGKPVRQLGNGLTWFPWLVFNITRENAQEAQGELPGDANHIHWEDEKTDLPPGKVRPIYVLSGEDPGGTLPSDKQSNLAVSMVVKFQLVEKRFFDLVRNVPPIDPGNAREIQSVIVGNTAITPRLLEVFRYLRDTAAAFAAEVIGQISYNEITKNRAKIDEWLALRIKLEMITWGPRLKEARFTQINPGHAYNQNLQKRGEASAARDAAVLLAEGRKQQLILEGEGAAHATLKGLEAQATGYKKIREDLGVSGEAVLAAQVGEKIAAGGNAVIADGLGGLGALVKAGSEAFKKPATGAPPVPPAGGPGTPGAANP